MMTTTQAAEELDLTTRRIRQLIADGDMEAVKAGRDFLIPKSEIEKARKRKTKPGPAPAKKAGK